MGRLADNHRLAWQVELRNRAGHLWPERSAAALLSRVTDDDVRKGKPAEAALDLELIAAQGRAGRCGRSTRSG